MPVVDLKTFNTFASSCRRGLESLAGVANSRFELFPLGACGDSAELIGRLLEERLGLGGQYVCGSRHREMKAEQTHAWFEAGGYIFDLTHDQPPGSGLQGWVLPLSSSWHGAFRTQDRTEGFCTPGNWPMYPYEGYAAMVKSLQNTLTNGQPGLE
jgi:hypothetical protein